jgi:hypothetical protein
LVVAWIRWLGALSQPCHELPVEVGDVVKAAAGQEAGLEVAVGPFDEPFGFRISRCAQFHGHPVAATERLELIGQPLLTAAPAADACLLVPHPLPWHRPELHQHLTHPAEDIGGGA